jgi:tetratricopeptide (TPR) repeat protein
MAQGAAYFAAASWEKDYKAANKASVSNMLWYYKAVQDTANYFRQAIYFYDAYYMNISADSAKKLDQASVDRLRASITNRQKAVIKIATIGKNNDKPDYPVAFTTFNTTNTVATTLNNIAYDFYALGSHNQAQLFKALIWCKRAIELQPVSGFYDTMAHIMYRLALYDEAELNQQKAINLAGKEIVQPQTLTRLTTELSKMKDHSL